MKIDALVARLEGAVSEPGTFNGDLWWFGTKSMKVSEYSPTKNWNQAGPIILRELICIQPKWNNAGQAHPLGYWSWSASILGLDTIDENFEQVDEHPLVAAMKCYIASKERKKT